MMTMTTMRALMRVLPLGLATLAAAPAAGQGTVLPWEAGAGVRMERYGFGEAQQVGIEDVSLLTVPFAAETRVVGRVRLGVAGAFASARMRRADGTEATLSGPTDTELRLNVPLAGDWLTLTGVAVLPTGTERLSAEELEVAAVVASDLLPFAISHWASSGGVGANLTLARRLGSVSLGISGGYRASREYRAFEEGGAAYRPGDESFVRVAVDRSAGTGKATLQAAAHRFTHDELGGGNLYRSGDRYELIASYAFVGGRRSSGVVYAGVLHRENGAALAELSGDFPSQQLFLAGAGMRMAFGRGALLPSVDGRIFRSADGVGQGFGVGVGASAEWPAGALTLVPSARLRIGNVLVRDGVESGFTGMELGFTLRRGRP